MLIRNRAEAIAEKWTNAIIDDSLAAEAFYELARELEEQLQTAQERLTQIEALAKECVAAGEFDAYEEAFRWILGESLDA